MTKKDFALILTILSESLDAGDIGRIEYFTLCRNFSVQLAEAYPNFNSALFLKQAELLQEV